MFLFTLRFHDKLMRQLNSHVFWSFFICDKCIRFNIIKFIFFNIGLSVFSYINQITYVFGAYHLTFFVFCCLGNSRVQDNQVETYICHVCLASGHGNSLELLDHIGYHSCGEGHAAQASQEVSGKQCGDSSQLDRIFEWHYVHLPRNEPTPGIATGIAIPN